MILHLQYFTIAVISFACLLSSKAQEEAQDPRLDVILAEVATLRDAVSAKQQTRTEKYIADLKALEEKTQSTGNLDKVLQVSEERTAWEAGTPTPTFDPKDETVILGLRKLRYYFDKEFSTIHDTARMNSEQQRTQIQNKFVFLEKALTTEGKITQAIETRKLKEQFIAGTLDTEPAATEGKNPVATVMPTAPSKPTATDQAIFPLRDPGSYPPLPTEKGRIVIVRPNGSSADFTPASFEKIERDDYDNVVALAEFMKTNEVAAILDDGRPVCWRKDGSKIDPRNVSAIKLWSGRSANLVWVDDEGHAGATDDNESIEKGLNKLGEVSALYPDHGFIFAIDSDGGRHLVGSNAEHANVIRAFENPNSIISAQYAGPNYIRILRNDGSVTESVTGNSPKTHSPAGSTTKLLAFHIWQRSDGGHTTSGSANQLLGRLEKESERIVNIQQFESHWVIEFPERRRQFFEITKDAVTQSEKLGQALAGAIDVRATSSGMIALLPASSVPRSGLWEIDDLIEARK